MGLWIFMLFIVLLIPGIMIGFGYRFLHHPPKEINFLYGYRTSRSMKNQDTWRFAHQYLGKRWVRWGLVCLPLSILPMLFVLGMEEDVIATMGSVMVLMQMIPVILPIFFTEHALKIHFDENGNKLQ